MRWNAVILGLALAAAACAQEDIELELEPGPAASASPAPSPTPAPGPAASAATEAPPAGGFVPRGPASVKRVILAVRTPGRNIPYRLALPKGYGPKPGPLAVLLDPHATSHRYLAQVDTRDTAEWTFVAPLLDMAEVEPGGWPAILQEILKDVDERFGIRGDPAVVAGFGAAATLAHAVANTPGLFAAVLADGGIVMGTPATQAGMKAAGVRAVAMIWGKEDITARNDTMLTDADSVIAAGFEVKVFRHPTYHWITNAEYDNEPGAYTRALAWLRRFGH